MLDQLLKYGYELDEDVAIKEITEHISLDVQVDKNRYMLHVCKTSRDKKWNYYTDSYYFDTAEELNLWVENMKVDDLIFPW